MYELGDKPGRNLRDIILIISAVVVVLAAAITLTALLPSDDGGANAGGAGGRRDNPIVWNLGDNGALNITESGKYYLVSGGGGTNENGVKVAEGLTVYITLSDAEVNGGSPFDIGGASVELTLKGNNVLRGGERRAAVRAPEGSSLLINGDGALTAEGGYGGAGIGGDMGEGCGNVTINGGVLSVRGGYGGAGIGGGKSGGGGYISVGGGHIAAEDGGAGAQGVGHGSDGAGGTLYMHGNSVIMASSACADGVRSSGVLFNGTLGLTYGTTALGGGLNLSVPAGRNLCIQSGTTLKVSEDSVLTNSGELDIALGGVLINDGIIRNNGVMTKTGEYRYDGGGELQGFKFTGRGYLYIQGWIYGETAKSPEYGTVPSGANGHDGTSSSPEYKRAGDESWSDSAPENAGVYSVRIVYSETDIYEEMVLTASLVIGKATYDMSDVYFNDKTAAWTGGAISAEIEGDLPYGVSVVYENNGKIAGGTYIVTAKFVGDGQNYHEIPSMTAVLTITIRVEVGGAGVASDFFDGYSPGTALPVPVREGFLFDGWYLTDNFSGDAVGSVNYSAKLFAKWLPVARGKAASPSAFIGIAIGGALGLFAVAEIIFLNKKKRAWQR